MNYRRLTLTATGRTRALVEDNALDQIRAWMTWPGDHVELVAQHALANAQRFDTTTLYAPGELTYTATITVTLPSREPRPAEVAEDGALLPPLPQPWEASR